MYGETTKWISRYSTVPVYSFWDVYLGHGIVGGKLISGYRQGQKAAKLALRILKRRERRPTSRHQRSGRQPIPVRLRATPEVPYPLSKLPKDAVFVNRPESFYQKYRNIVWTTVAICLCAERFRGGSQPSRRAPPASRGSAAGERSVPANGVFESSPIPIVVMDAATFKYIDCNLAAIEIYRFASREETLGKTPLDVSASMQYDGTLHTRKPNFISPRRKPKARSSSNGATSVPTGKSGMRRCT